MKTQKKKSTGISANNEYNLIDKSSEQCHHQSKDLLRITTTAMSNGKGKSWHCS
jgi:delta-aminolevulinic acid dehydratase/porphobilinogen synthase